MDLPAPFQTYYSTGGGMSKPPNFCLLVRPIYIHLGKNVDGGRVLVLACSLSQSQMGLACMHVQDVPAILIASTSAPATTVR